MNWIDNIVKVAISKIQQVFFHFPPGHEICNSHISSWLDLYSWGQRSGCYDNNNCTWLNTRNCAWWVFVFIALLQFFMIMFTLSIRWAFQHLRMLPTVFEEKSFKSMSLRNKMLTEIYVELPWCVCKMLGSLKCKYENCIFICWRLYNRNLE